MTLGVDLCPWQNWWKSKSLQSL